MSTATLSDPAAAAGICQCGCGARTAIVRYSDKSKGLTKGQPRRFLKGHHNRIHGCSATWRSFRAMHHRCYSPSYHARHHYGGRGIGVCDEWRAPEGYPQFLSDMGERPAGMTLDRIDPDGNYEPGNCRWATALEQRRNRRDR